MRVFELLRQADWRLLLPVTGFLVACYALLVVRWRYLLANKPSLGKMPHILTGGFMFSIVTRIPNTPYWAAINELSA